MEAKKMRIRLPGDFSIGKVSALFEETRDIGKDVHLELDLEEIERIDSAGVAFLNYLEKNFSRISFENAKPELHKVLELFSRDGRQTHDRDSQGIIEDKVSGLRAKSREVLASIKKFWVLLVDEIYYTVQYLVKKKGVYPGEILNQLYYMGYNSYPIVSVISFLVGITISITSAEQLRNFGADIFLADLVGFGMIRELVPLMTGIILAGKIGASITAEISSMKVMEEVDALKTMGLIPEKFLMVPRLIAITLTIPLLVAIADLIGISAGVLVAQVVSKIPPEAFFNEMFLVVGLADFFIGLGKTLVFGWIIVISSGYKGFSVQKGAAEVGVATTESVVLSISLIIVTDCIFAFILY